MSTPTSHQNVQLRRGRHLSPDDGACVMEVASMLAGEPFSDRPRSVCPVVASYLRSLNDILDDHERQLLYPYASAAVGSAGDDDARRLRLAHCRMAFCAANAQRSPLTRAVMRAAGAPPVAAPVALESFTLRLVRALRRTDAHWPRLALALADELLAISRTGDVVADVERSRPAAELSSSGV
jgi:hypothetical protein